MDEYLYLIAELAVAFAGFTAIVSALDTKGRSETRGLDILRLRMMLELSLTTTACALLPALLVQTGVGQGAWRMSGWGAAVLGLLLYVVQVRRGFSEEIRKSPGYSLAYSRFIAGLGMVGVSCFWVAASGFVFRPAGPYHIGVTMLLVVAGLQFYRACVSIMEHRIDRWVPNP